MATYNVSNASALKSAINAAKGGDIIRLAAGNYGKLELSKKFSGNVTITSASDSNKAKFTGIVVKNSANVTFDSLKFEGSGGGYGFLASNCSNLKVNDSTFSKLMTGLKIYTASNIAVTNNYYTAMDVDAMHFGGLSNAVIQGNKYVEQGSRAGYTHKDFIQFFTGANGGPAANGVAPSKNVKIIDNEFYSKDGLTHGILILNENRKGFHQNIDIYDNYFKSSSTHGISVADTNDLEIRNNILIKDGKLPPLINVTPNSTNVKILNNTAPSVPDVGNSTWIVSNNKETAGSVKHWTGGHSGIKVVNTGSAGATGGSNTDAVPEPQSPPDAGSPATPGGADEFRFSAKKLGGGTTSSTVADLDFGDGDFLVFIDYRKDTFRDDAGGAAVWNSPDGTYVRIYGLKELKELDKSSPAVSVSASKSSDVLTMTIAQGDATHKLALHGLADEYLGL